MSNEHELILNLTQHLLEVETRLQAYEEMNSDNMDAFFLCINAIIIFLMQAGFAFLEAGAVRSKNTNNILFINLMDAFLSIIGYWAIGWGLSWGPVHNEILGRFIGQGDFFSNDMINFKKFFFQFAFAATTGTIVTGAVAERCEFSAYVIYSCTMTSFVYPVLAHWGFNDEGWMKYGFNFNGEQVQYLDFAGAGIVHICGGIISLAAAYVIGPRIGRFPSKPGEEVREIKGHSTPLVILGGFILIAGFLAFNGGSTGTISTPGVGRVESLAMTNTIMCGAWATVLFLMLTYIQTGKLSVLNTLNACLAGEVAATAGCNDSHSWSTVLTGGGAALTYLFFSKLMIRCRIDDPLDAFAVHAGGGLWGLISTVIARDRGIIHSIIAQLRGKERFIGFAFVQLGWQLICIMAIVVWSLVWMVPVFLILMKLNMFRIAPEIELKGIDFHKHGEVAYPRVAYDFDDCETSQITTSTVEALEVPQRNRVYIVVADENDKNTDESANPSD